MFGSVKAMIRSHEKERAAWAAERKELLDRIMYLSDRPWGLPERESYAPKDLVKERYYLDGHNEVN